MEFRLLGPLEIDSGDRLVQLARRRERCLLGVLLLSPRQVVPLERLAELLWEGDPPEQARRAVHSHVSRIRTALQTASDRVQLATVRKGYRIDIDPQLVDAGRFRRHCELASGTPDPATRVDLLRAALDLWRGAVLADDATPWLRDRLCADLEEQRLRAVEDLTEACLTLRREQQVLPELAQVAAAHPGRERLVALHMQALYLADRKADALAAYARARGYLSEELGLDPSPRLRELHQAILRDQLTRPADPIAAGSAAATPAPAILPRQLPRDLASFVGRSDQLAHLDQLAGDGAAATVVVTAIGGTAGVGKTTFAVHWAHRVADRFPDGHLFVDLRGHHPEQPPRTPSEVARVLLDALGIPPAQVPADPDAQLGRYRSLLAGKRMLIMLDNARDAAQVRPLLPGAAGCLAVVTSRNQLSGLAATDGAHLLRLDLLPAADARRLLAARLGDHRLAAEPAAVERILAACAGLPLALAIVAARAASWPSLPLATLAEQLPLPAANLDAWSGSDPATNLRAVLSWSYQALAPPAARLFRLLSLHPGPDIAAPAAAGLAGVPVSVARALLTELAESHLLNEHAPGRYRCHDLLRAYAAELTEDLDPPTDRDLARQRMSDHYLHTAHAAALRLSPHRKPITLSPPAPAAAPEPVADAGAALDWFARERQSLLALVPWAASVGGEPIAWQLGWALADFLRRQGHWHDWVEVQRIGLAAAQRLGDRSAQALCHHHLAGAQLFLGAAEEARTHLRHTLELSRDLGDRIGQARAHLDLGAVLEQLGRHQESLEHTEQALALSRAEHDRAGEANALNGISWLHTRLGDYPAAIRHGHAARALHRQLDNRDGLAATWDSLGYAHHQLGEHRPAIECFAQALALVREIGNRFVEAQVLDHLGDAQQAAGDPAAARDAWRTAAGILRDMDHPDADQIQRKCC